MPHSRTGSNKKGSGQVELVQSSIVDIDLTMTVTTLLVSRMETERCLDVWAHVQTGARLCCAQSLGVWDPWLEKNFMRYLMKEQLFAHYGIQGVDDASPPKGERAQSKVNSDH